jgi:formylglycine-generating enzyme required for sulfatase activity
MEITICSIEKITPYARNAPGSRGSGQMPVEQVSWDDCQEFMRRLNVKTPGGGFRLPTEAEWEYAARAGSSSVPSRQELMQSAWYRENAASAAAGRQYLDLDAYAPRRTGAGQPNLWGFHDMLGNVWEWCSSALRPYPFDPHDGREALAGRDLRVVRGGGFADAAETFDPAVRHGESPGRRYRWNGLRLARSLRNGDQ